MSNERFENMEKAIANINNYIILLQNQIDVLTDRKIKRDPFEVSPSGENKNERWKKHGMSGTPIYRIWQKIKKSCDGNVEPNSTNFKSLGIKLCNHWSEFAGFYAEMSDGYTEGMRLKRHDPRKRVLNKENCYWQSPKENN